MKRAVGSSACMPVRRPAPLSAAHYFNAPSTPHSGHFAISPSASGWVVTSRRGLHVSAPVGAAKVNPRNMNQAVRKDMQSIEAVRKRHDELRKQKQLEQEEAAGKQEEEQDFYVRLAYKELADEELRQRDPSKWRDTELFEINQLFNRRRAIMEWKHKQLKGKTLREASRTSQRTKHINAERHNYDKAEASGGGDDADA